MTTTTAPYSVASEEGHFDEKGHYVFHNIKRKPRYAVAYPTNGQIFIEYKTQDQVKEGVVHFLRSQIAEVFKGKVQTQTTSCKDGVIIKWGPRA